MQNSRYHIKGILGLIHILYCKSSVLLLSENNSFSKENKQNMGKLDFHCILPVSLGNTACSISLLTSLHFTYFTDLIILG